MRSSLALVILVAGVAVPGCALLDAFGATEAPTADEGEGEGDLGEGEGEGDLGEGEGEPLGSACFEDAGVCLPCVAEVEPPALSPPDVVALQWLDASPPLLGAVLDGSEGVSLRLWRVQDEGVVLHSDTPLDIGGHIAAGAQLSWNDASRTVSLVFAPQTGEGQFELIAVDPVNGNVTQGQGLFSFLGPRRLFFAARDESGIGHIAVLEDPGTLSDRTVRIDGYERRCPATMFFAGALESEIDHELFGVATDEDAMVWALVRCGRVGFAAHVLALVSLDEQVLVVQDLSDVDDVVSSVASVGGALAVVSNTRVGDTVHHTLRLVANGNVAAPVALSDSETLEAGAGSVRIATDGASQGAAVLGGAGLQTQGVLLGSGAVLPLSDVSAVAFSGTHLIQLKRVADPAGPGTALHLVLSCVP